MLAWKAITKGRDRLAGRRPDSGGSPAGRSDFSERAQPVLWFLKFRIRLRSSRKRKSENLRPEVAVGFVFFVGFARSNTQRIREKSAISDLIHWPPVGRGAGRPGEKGVVDVYETLQQRCPAPIAPDQGHKRAAGPWPGLNLVPPALYHVWCHAKTPEDQHPRRSRRGPKADARAGQRT